MSPASPAFCCQGTTASALQEAVEPKRLRWETTVVNKRATIPYSSMSWFSLLQIDVDVEEPETSENPTRSFEIHNIVWRRTHLWAVIMYII